MPSKVSHQYFPSHHYGNVDAHKECEKHRRTQRRGPIAAEFSTPGPAMLLLPSTFGPNSRDQRKVKSPSFTIGMRREEKRDVATPGPGEYEVEGVTRNGKDWVQTAYVAPRLKDPEPYITPGPIYNVHGVTRMGKDWVQTAFVSPRFKEPERFNTPSPGAYNVKDIYSMKAQPPSYSFGQKIKGPDPYCTPSPTAYHPDRSTNLIRTKSHN